MELQRALGDFEAAGVAVFAVSYDPIGAIAQFCGEHGIGFPFLADEGSELIRSLGILNTLIEAEEPVYGIPFPGGYVLDERGVVTHKFFHRNYQTREAASLVLREALGVTPRLEGFPRVEVDRPGVRVSATLGAPDLKFQQRVDLYVRLDLDPGLHVLGPRVPEGYAPTEVAIRPPEGVTAGQPRYPAPAPFRLEGTEQPFEGYEGTLEVPVELLSDLQPEAPGASLPLHIELRYQACNDRECLLPEELRLHLDVPFGTLNRGPRPAE